MQHNAVKKTQKQMLCLHNQVKYFWLIVLPNFHAVFHCHNDVVSSVVHALLRTLLGRTCTALLNITTVLHIPRLRHCPKVKTGRTRTALSNN